MKITKEQLEKESEIAKSVLEKYSSLIPRFKVNGMNKSEFILHCVAIGFNAGCNFVRDNEIG